MSDEIELDDLTAKETETQQTDETKLGPNITDNAEDQTVTIWAYVASILLVSLAIPLIFFPRVLLWASESVDEQRLALTPLESYLAVNGGILLLTFALALLFNIPTSDRPIMEAKTQSPQGHPLLIPLTTASSLIAFLSYNTKSVASLAFLVFIGAAIIAAWGWWTVMFAGSAYRSRKTGADKRTSGFLFGNKTAASAKKKQWKKEQQSKNRRE